MRKSEWSGRLIRKVRFFNVAFRLFLFLSAMTKKCFTMIKVFRRCSMSLRGRADFFVDERDGSYS
jgi:hypothetical protein